MIYRRWLALLVSILGALSPIIFWLGQPTIAQTGPDRIQPTATRRLEKLDDDLAAALVDAEPDQALRFIVHMAATADLRQPSPAHSALARRTAIIQTRQQTAAASQHSLRKQLDAWQDDGQVDHYQTLWIINAIAVSGAADVIPSIAARADVARISLDARRRYFDPPSTGYGSILANRQQLAAAEQHPVGAWGVERVRAAAAWHGLGVDGSGVAVAIMDSGVDWLHPDLFPNYRGNKGNGSVDHAGNWFHAADPSITTPVDGFGHGTHVAGTAVGQNGLGVAPGADWIAVSIADENGFIYDSDVHRGFEWLLAPNGDPALAPDIVNNSWGGNPYNDNFYEDVVVLQAAGIIPVFAAGNTGPAPMSVNSPASYTGTLAVAASDDVDAVAWFSSRGPSPFTAETKPWIAAPGTTILSALPDGRYGIAHGTSMATPHVAGTMALLLAANPALTQAEIAAILAGSAAPIAPAHPNADSGWGRLDAYAAVQTQVETGVLGGIVRGNGAPLPGVAITITTGTGAAIPFLTDEDGRYQASLRPGVYRLVASSFGYAKESGGDLIVSAHQTTTHNLSLTALPGGTVSGLVRQAATGAPLPAMIHVEGAPVTAATDEDGRYTLQLPDGQYKLRVEASGHRLGRAVVLAQAGQAVTQHFILETAPSLLLVDSGQWYYDSQAAFYRESLTGLNRSFDVWPIRDPFTDVPTPADLAAYGTVIWSSPNDSPGFIGAGAVISDYLGLGGNLLISGQHVGSFDGDGIDTQHWWVGLLAARFMGKTAVTATLNGAPNTPFAGLSPGLNVVGSAGNQVGPDRSRPQENALTRPAFLFDDGLAGGLLGGHCRPFRIAYFGFGLEGTAAGDRAAILHRSFDYFASPRQAVGAEWRPEAIGDFALAGERLVYTLTVRNLSETLTDTLRLSAIGDAWPAALVTDTLTLGPCQAGRTVLTIDAPPGAAADEEHFTQVTAVSGNDPAFAASLNVRHKIPGHILLVDDDRWYDQEAIFGAMLDAMGLKYDVWEIGWDNNVRGSPPQAILDAYDIVLWYTAYDWFAPITAGENETLTRYLAQGGRLFLTSQDFLYYHHQTPLARDYLGVIEYRESVTPTLAYGAGNPLLPPDLAGPLPLDYTPYQNFSDGLVPAVGSRPFIWLDQGVAGGVATAGADWRSVFLSFPLEKLPIMARTQIMNSIIGWLSDLGETTFDVDRRTGPPDEPRTYTIALRNLADAPENRVTLTNTLPVSLTLLPGTISGGAVYDPATRRLTWTGQMAGGASHQIRYQAVPRADLHDGSRLENRLQVHNGRHDLAFERVAALWVDAPDLSGSTLAVQTGALAASQRLTYTLRLENGGQRTAPGGKAVIRFSEIVTPVLGGPAASLGMIESSANGFTWTGDLAPGAAATVTLVLNREPSLAQQRLPVTAVLDDGVTAVWLLYDQRHLPPWTRYFPIVARME